MSRLILRKVAVLGAGVMGAQIAAHLANADVPVLLFDLPGADGSGSTIARKAIESLKKLQPAPLASRERVQYIDAANYGEHLALLADCDLVIEAIAEKKEWKEDLFRRVAPHLGERTIFASNTSGLSVQRLAEALPAPLRPRFCGIHFFNPPRYMKLVELIPIRETAADVLDGLESWLVSRLGKGVVRAFDTPNFIANRLGVFSMLSVFHHTSRLGLGLDEVDALTGPLIGRPKSATYRTADVVGLDTLAHVVNTMAESLPDDPWHAHFYLPDWLQGLISAGALGQKSGGGIFRKEGRTIQVFDPDTGGYRPADREAAPEALALMKIADPAARFAALAASMHPHARLLWSIHRDIFHYTACLLAGIAGNARDVDQALRWGFGWARGPLETWQSIGWQAIAQAIQADIDAGRALSGAPLPGWVFEREGVHGPDGSYSARDGRVHGRSELPVYSRQLFQERLPGETADTGHTVFETAGVRMWTLPEVAKGIALVSFKSRMHALGSEVTAGLREAIARAERDFDGLVIWHEAPFAVGADLKELLALVEAGDFARIEVFVADFQRSSMAIKYAQVPVVAAVEGMALGGGCEFAQHAARRVVALESQMGLVEAGVGLIPAGGGCKELALRAARIAAQQQFGEPAAAVGAAFQNVSMTKISKSALEARDMGFVSEADTLVMNAGELPYVAIRQARALAESGWHPALPARAVPVAGRAGIAALEM
ncbi:MAG: 3-hydroxyacyl-CoA dehydrogenase/enoyl-CoA hydratase family protein, partial [Zoogloea sp.]|nr:3-hydroxyacyl-CoA dehydrogenase/enoyl-CoA hydratase family protein [Zoogloea sp.]